MELKEIKELIKVLSETSLTEISFEKENNKVLLKKSKYEVQAQEEIEEVEEIELKEIKEIKEIKSLNIGKFYFKTPINVGDTITNGQIIGFVEAIGIKTNVVSEYAGKVSEILISEGGIAEYAKTLIKVEL